METTHNMQEPARSNQTSPANLVAGVPQSGMPDNTPLLTAILESSLDAIIGKDLDNIIVSWSRGAEHIYGYSSTEAIGRSITLLMPPDRTHEAAEIIARIQQGQRLESVETVRRTKAGHLIDVSLTVSPVYDAAGLIIGALTIGRDISHHKQNEQAVRELEANARRRAFILETASRVALDILASRTGAAALRHITDAARILANARYAALGVAQSDGKGLSEFVTVGLTPEEEAAIGPRPRGMGVLGLLLDRTEPLRLDALEQHPASIGFPANHPHMDSFLGVPIRRGSTVVGSLYLANKQGGGPFTEADEVAVQALGAHAAVAIHNMQMLTRQRALTRQLITAQEEERRAVAYDLHDGLTQYVMASHAHLESFRRAHQNGQTDRATREMDMGLKYLKEAVVESRRLINGLRLLALDDLGLAGATEQLINEEKSRAGWEQAAFRQNIGEHRFDKALETGVYRIAQEALSNVRKHAAATRVQVALLIRRQEHTGDAQLYLKVRDWGRGFSIDHKIDEYEHIGLQGMIERVQLLGGTYTLHSAPGAGTALAATFPILEAPAVHDAPADGAIGQRLADNAASHEGWIKP